MIRETVKPTLSPDKMIYDIYCDIGDIKPVNRKDMATGSTCSVIDKIATKKLTVFMFREDNSLGADIYGEWVAI